MNLPELQQDDALRRRAFPVCTDKVYLAHAGVSPVPRLNYSPTLRRWWACMLPCTSPSLLEDL